MEGKSHTDREKKTNNIISKDGNKLDDIMDPSGNARFATNDGNCNQYRNGRAVSTSVTKELHELLGYSELGEK